ncbi:MAG: transposase, partial [Planctomycetota bacterium]
YERLECEAARPVIPPRKNAKLKRHGNSSEPRLPRDEALRKIRSDGRRAWEEESGYHRRSLAETAMSRMKRSFGDRLKNRKPPNQKTEVALRTKILNAFVAIGMPMSLWI